MIRKTTLRIEKNMTPTYRVFDIRYNFTKYINIIFLLIMKILCTENVLLYTTMCCILQMSDNCNVNYRRISACKRWTFWTLNACN